MRNSKMNSKKKLTGQGEPLTKEEFVASIKKAEKGPFKPLKDFEGFVEEIKVGWEKKYNSKRESTSFSPSLSKEEFIASIKEAEKGPFYSHNELVLKFNSWKKTLKK